MLTYWSHIYIYIYHCTLGIFRSIFNNQTRILLDYQNCCESSNLFVQYIFHIRFSRFGISISETLVNIFSVGLQTKTPFIWWDDHSNYWSHQKTIQIYKSPTNAPCLRFLSPAWMTAHTEESNVACRTWKSNEAEDKSLGIHKEIPQTIL